MSIARGKRRGRRARRGFGRVVARRRARELAETAKRGDVFRRELERRFVARAGTGTRVGVIDGRIRRRRREGVDGRSRRAEGTPFVVERGAPVRLGRGIRRRRRRRRGSV